ncbi:MAG TPA: FecR domain-containing protein, partial [Planctomycetota bacterium]|nr:FecR domain-containing protein [Planctomycetota bacterium]
RRAATGAPTPIAAWVGAGLAAAVTILLIGSALRSERKPAGEPIVQVPVPVPGTPTVRPSAPPPPAPVIPLPSPPRRPIVPPQVEPPVGPAPKEEPEKPESEPPAPVKTPPPADTPPSTRAARAVAVIREIEGTFDLAEKTLRGKQKEVGVAAGDKLKASALVRLTLADDRVVLLSPRTVVEFRPEEKRLALVLEQGEVLADLIGPGPEIKVVTKACDATPLGTVFSVRVVSGRSILTVEKGRVDVQSARGRVTLRAAEMLQAAEDGTLGPAAPADFRAFAWVRGHRPAELTLYAEEFTKPGAWEAEIDKGVAKAAVRPGSGPTLHLAAEKPLFEVPVRGALTIVCRADRTSKLKVQLFAGDVRTTYKAEVPILRSSEWRTLTIAFDDLVPSDKTRITGRPAPGSPISDLLLMYGEEDERGSFWVDSIKVTEVRP